MSRPVNYAKLYTLRSDGRYQGYYRDSDGKRHSVCDRDPEKLYRKLEKLSGPKPVTVGELLDGWERDHVAALEYKTQEAYRAPIRRIGEEFGDCEAESVTAKQITTFMDKLRAQAFGKRSVQMHLTAIKSAYRWGILNDKISIDPSEYVKLPKGLKADTRKPPEDAALEAILDSVGVPFSEFVLLLYYTGLRRGEALALRQEDIDRDRRIIHVRRAVSFEHNHPYIKSTKTESGVRDVYFPPALLPLLPTQKGYIFSDDGEHLLSREVFLYRWRKYCEAIGHQLTPHQLRHFYVSAMDDAGVPVTVTQAQVGHANTTTTLNIYTHLRSQKMQRSHAAIDAYFSPSDGNADGKNPESIEK